MSSEIPNHERFRSPLRRPNVIKSEVIFTFGPLGFPQGRQEVTVQRGNKTRVVKVSTLPK